MLRCRENAQFGLGIDSSRIVKDPAELKLLLLGLMFSAPLNTKINRWDISIQDTVVKLKKKKTQFKSVTDNCFIPHTCLGVTTAGMPLLKLHPLTPQGETCLGCIHFQSFLSCF